LDWSFFHGTTTLHANRILEHGSSNYLESIRARHLASELWTRLKSRYGGVNGAVERLQELNCTFTLSVAMALASITGEVSAKNFEYGDLCATLGLQRAARYALISPFGSELLGILADVIKTLQFDGEKLGPLLNGFPELIRAISQPSPPVVLEFRGMGMDQVTASDGAPIGQAWFDDIEELLTILHPSNHVDDGVGRLYQTAEPRLPVFARGDVVLVEIGLEAGHL
jgi:hypothetical protein